MFFYLSFLRPPPTHAYPSTPILITPQVANDLRTETCYTDQDIYFDWVPADATAKSPSAGAGSGNPRAFKTPTKKLMTWRSSNAYKEVPVPPPYGVREGQKFRLILSAVPVPLPAGAPRAPPGRIYLDDEKVGKWHPFSVASMPVTFTSTAKGAPKQEEIERAYEFKLDWIAVGSEGTGEKASRNSENAAEEIVNQLRNLQVEENPLNVVNLLIREQTSFDLDKKIWDSGIGLSAWLVQWFSRACSGRPEAPSQGADDVSATRLKDTLKSQKPLRILELGTGIGIVALVLAALRSRLADANDSILTTDLESAIPLLQHNIDVNEPTRSQKVSLKCGVLDWDQNLSEQLPDEEGFDLVAMADVTYNTGSFPALVQTLSGLRNLNPSKTPCFLLGYKQRHDEERTLWDMAEAIGVKFIRVGSVPGHSSEDAPVEIWIG